MSSTGVAGKRIGSQMHVVGTRTRRRGGGVEYRMRVFLVGKLDVHKGRERLNWSGVLCMIEEISMAGLELRVPIDDIELRTCFWTLRLSLWTLAIASE